MARSSVSLLPQGSTDPAVMLNFHNGWGMVWHVEGDKAAVTITDPDGEVVPLKDSVVDSDALARLIGWAVDLSGLSRVVDVS